MVDKEKNITTPKPNNKEALGKGIRSLLQSIDSDLKTAAGSLKPQVAEAARNINRIVLEEIETNPRQPRIDFDDAALQDLAASIKMHDIIQPITVSKLPSGKYKLISGERRYRASKIAGLKDIPAYIRQANDTEILEFALLENLQREDLNSIEIALSYKRMMDELGYTQEKIAERMGIDRSTVANFIRLLKLPPDIQLSVRKSEVSMAHARAIVNIETVEKQLFVFKEIKAKELSVRQTEALVRSLYKAGSIKKTSKIGLPAGFQKIEDNLSSHFSTRIKLKHSKTGSGQILIDYYSLDELNGILEKMNL